MILEEVTESNVHIAIKIQEELFPGESGKANFEEAVAGRNDAEYFLIYEDDSCIGITGIYSYPEDHDNAWLGWFGIRAGYRRNHYGSASLKMFEDMAIARGYKFARLYTDVLDNDEAIAFYRSNGYESEPYQNMQDPVCFNYKVFIFSKSLTSEELVPWNSRNIHLTEQIKKQEKYNRTE